jgi:PKD repeat protein
MEGDNKGHLQKGYPADSTDYFVKGKSIKLNLDPSPSAATPDISIYGIGPSGPVQFFSVDIQNPFSLQRSPMIQSSGSGNINSKVNVGNHASGSGTTYYVDAINGSDANNGLAPEKAWKTINKVNNSIYMPGDSILFKRGETWREQLTVPTSGSAGNPITFGAYGTGTKPIFNGAEIITTWTDSGVVTENTWKAILTTQPYAVWFDNTLGQKQESLAACRSARDWYWASNVIYVYPTTDADTAYSSPGIEASARSTLYMTDKNYVTIENIEFTKGGNALVDDVSVKFRQSKNIVIQDCDITKSVNIGLDIYKVDGTTGDTLVQRCSFSDTGLAKGSAGANSAIQTYNTGDDPTFTVQYCTFRNIDNFGAHHGHGIYHLSGKLIWRYNFHYGDNGGFLNTGAAVRLASTGGAQIYYNIFSDIGGKRYWGICGGEGTNLIYNNIFYNNHYAIYSGGRGTESFVVKNNIFCCSTTGVHIQHIEFTGKVKSYSGTNNLFYNIDGFDIFSWAGVEKATLALWKIASHQDENALNVDPKFISTSILDFHLLPASPCIYAGADVGLTQDYEGNSIRGLPDIGAFEFSDGTSSLIASAKGSPTTGQAPLTVNFTGKATGGTSPYSYSWNFGDGQSSSLQNPSHIFSSAGTYKVVLKVTDSRNATDTESLTIVVTSSGDTALELQLLIKSSVSS